MKEAGTCDLEHSQLEEGTKVLASLLGSHNAIHSSTANGIYYQLDISA